MIKRILLAGAIAGSILIPTGVAQATSAPRPTTQPPSRILWMPAGKVQAAAPSPPSRPRVDHGRVVFSTSHRNENGELVVCYHYEDKYIDCIEYPSVKPSDSGWLIRLLIL